MTNNMKAWDKAYECSMNWFHSCEFKSAEEVMKTYPKMMRKVLKVLFGMPKNAADMFVQEACYGNWKKIHETDDEKNQGADEIAENLRWEVSYCSDRWSWDRVIRVQWLYQRLVRRFNPHF